MKDTPDKDHVYGLYDPEDSGYTFYATEKERDDAAKEVIEGYYYYDKSKNIFTWLDKVEDVFAFTVTALATQIDVKRPQGELDEEGFDENEDWWRPDDDFSCDYALKPFQP